MNDTLLNETILTPATSPGTINARLDRLPVTRAVWLFVILLSLGGWFEFYDLFLTAYVGPGLVRDGLLTSSTQNFFGFSGLGALPVYLSAPPVWDGSPTALAAAGFLPRPYSGIPLPRSSWRSRPPHSASICGV
jgi:hypothetical protein